MSLLSRNRKGSAGSAPRTKKQKVAENDGNKMIGTNSNFTPLDLPDVVGEVFKWFDGYYLTPILVQKSWRELVRKRILLYLKTEFGIKSKSVDAAWDTYKKILKNNGLPEVAILYRVSQSKEVLTKISIENVSEKQEILENILKNNNYSIPRYTGHLLKNWRQIYQDIKRCHFSRLNTEYYKQFLSSFNSFSEDSEAIERLIKRLKVQYIDRASYSHMVHKSYEDGMLELLAIDSQGEAIKTTCHYAMYLNLSHDDARGYYEWYIDGENTFLATMAPRGVFLSDDAIRVPSTLSNEIFDHMLFPKEIEALLERLNEPKLDPVKFYCLVLMLLSIAMFTPKKDIIPHPVLGAMETDLGNYSNSIALVSHKYNALQKINKIVDERHQDPSLWSNFFNYQGPRRDEYFQQIKQLALQLNFLAHQVTHVRFNIDSCAPGFGYYINARIVIGHEGESVKGKLVLNYLHEIYMNDKIDGGLYGGEESEKECGVTCFVSLNNADEIVFPPAHEFHAFSATEMIPSTNSIFMPETIQPLIPKEFDLISFDTFSDMLIIMLGFHDFATGGKTSNCETRYCGGDYSAFLPCLRWCSRRKHETIAFNAKTYDIDIDKIAQGFSPIVLTEEGDGLEY